VSTPVITALIAGFVAVIVAVVSAMGARNAQKATADTQRRQDEAEEQRKRDEAERVEAQRRAEVEAHAYQRARESYERIVKDLENQLDRNQRTVQSVQDQLDRVLRQLAAEQDVSNSLRDQVRGMQHQIRTLEQENEQFRALLAEHGRVTSTLQSDLRRAGIDGADH
jgi:chromosome segregation ATPase